MEYRLLDKKEINQVILLVDKVAKKHIFNDYDQEGIDSFNQVNQESFYLDRHNLTYVALENDQVVAMATLSNNNHLSLLFVLDSYQHLGIGTKLLEIIDNLVLGDLSVNSGIEAKDFYLKAGFELTDNLIKKDGILYYPMVKKREVKQQFENYDQVIEFINSQKDRVYSLDNFKRYMDDLVAFHFPAPNQGNAKSYGYVLW